MYPTLAIASDIHVDLYNNMVNSIFSDFDKPEHKDMILCLAGDIFTDTKPELLYFKDFLIKCSQYFKHVVWVAGNHDLWGYNLFGDDSFDEQMVTLCDALGNVHYLTMDDTTIIDGIEFWGHTFWTKIENPVEQVQVQSLIDYQNIFSSNGEDLFVYNTNEVNRLARTHLKSFLNFPKNHKQWGVDKRVVMTHFPLFREKLPEYPNAFDVYYNNHMDYELAYIPQPDLYIYGHTHTAEDYDFMGARVICNPRGYPSQSGNFKMKYFTFGEISEQN